MDIDVCRWVWKPEVVFRCSFLLLSIPLWDNVFHWTYSSVIVYTGWPSSQCLPSLPSPGVRGACLVCLFVCFYYGCREADLRSSCVRSKYLTHWVNTVAHSSSLETVYYKTLVTGFKLQLNKETYIKHYVKSEQTQVSNHL